MAIDCMEITGLVAEYDSILEGSHELLRDSHGSIDWGRTACLLEKHADWTAVGAREIAALAQRYGTFVLRNALALAVALEVEDGTCGL